MGREVEVRFFGNLSRLAGGRTRRIVVEGETPTVADLRSALAAQVPSVAPQLDHTAVGSGTELLDDDAPLPDRGELALLPPVSGG